MPGFLSALFAAPEGDELTAATSDHLGVDETTAFDISVHIHAAEDGTEQHADGSATNWSTGQDIGAHLDVHTLSQLGLDENHS